MCAYSGRASNVTRLSWTDNDHYGQAEPKLADQVDEDGRLPIHWAASSNSKDIVLLLSNRRNFDPDAQVGSAHGLLAVQL
jgi:ankyrin repeat protein